MAIEVYVNADGAIKGEFDCIAHQVEQNLLEPFCISQNLIRDPFININY
jgi:hypothetical protein